MNGEDRYGLLDSAYDSTPASSLKQRLLSGLQFPLSGGVPVTTPSFTLSQNPSTVISATSNTDLGGSGDTTEVTYTAAINNRTSSDESSASITLTLPAAGVVITEASTGATATCSTAATAYTCNFATIPSSGSGGLTLTAIYPAANLTFNSGGQSSQVVTAAAAAGSQTLTPASVTTIVDKQGQQSNTAETIVATPAPGYSYNYGQQGTVSFTLSPAPSSPIPISSLSAQLDGSQGLTVTSVGSNQYQIPVGLLSGGNHSVVIRLAGSSSYAAASATVSLAVQKAAVTLSVAGAPLTGNYGSLLPIVANLSGLSGTGFAAPSGSVSLVIDNLAPLTAQVSGNIATFATPAGLPAGSHSLNLNYTGDANYAAQAQGSTLTLKPVALVATASAASRPFGAPNPVFTGTLTGVLNGDGITATYVSQANATTAEGIYSTGVDAITPVLSDPNNRLANYSPQLVVGALTVTAAASGTAGTDITWPIPAAIVYGTPLTAAQLNASSSLPGTFVYKPVAGTVLGAGPQTLSVTFTPSGATPETGHVTLLVNQASTTTTLTAINATIAGSVTLSAIVTSIDGGAATGSVQFLDGSTSIASVTINSTGAASYFRSAFQWAAHTHGCVFGRREQPCQHLDGVARKREWGAGLSTLFQPETIVVGRRPEHAGDPVCLFSGWLYWCRYL